MPETKVSRIYLYQMDSNFRIKYDVTKIFRICLLFHMLLRWLDQGNERGGKDSMCMRYEKFMRDIYWQSTKKESSRDT